jgi:hypothetical protein
MAKAPVKAAPPWYKPKGVLTPEKHERLVANLENYARDAGIPKELIWKALPALSVGEKDWLANFNKHRSEGYCGLLITGEPELNPLSRIGAMAGFLTRNFVRARVFSLLDTLDAVANNDDIVAKGRKGETGRFTVNWDFDHTTDFSEILPDSPEQIEELYAE